MKCQKCGREFEEKFMDGHHLHPIFMDNQNGSGEIITLCNNGDRGCHWNLHRNIINPLLWKYARVLKKINNEHWLWIKILPIDRERCIEEIIKETKRWLNGNPATT